MWIFQSRNGALDIKNSFPLNIYKILDINKDGHISIMEMKKSEEFGDAFVKSSGASPKNRNSLEKINIENVFKELDKNNNGKIEPKEIDITLDGVNWVFLKIESILNESSDHDSNGNHKRM